MINSIKNIYIINKYEITIYYENLEFKFNNPSEKFYLKRDILKSA